MLWGRDPERMLGFETSRESDKLPGVRLAGSVRATAAPLIAARKISVLRRALSASVSPSAGP